MKKFLSLMLSILSIFALFSCGGSAEGSYTILGSIIKIGDGYITLLVTEDGETGIEYQVNLNSDTVYEKDCKRVTADALAEGITVSVSYNGMTTRSIPPQINAERIFIEQKSDTKQKSGAGEVFQMTATVTEISDDSITVEVTESKYASGAYVVHISSDTAMLSEAGEAIRLADIKVGDSVDIIYGDATTLSLPPQIVAEKIQIN